MFDKESFQWFLSKSITLYCKSVLPNSSFRVDVMIGITVNDADVATLICFSESIVRSEHESDAQNSGSQVALEGVVKQENECNSMNELKSTSSSAADELNNNPINEPNTIQDVMESRVHPARHKSGRFVENNYPKIPPDVKQELLESSTDTVEAGENGYDDDDDDDCYVEEPEAENEDNSYGQEPWNDGDWNDSNYVQNKTEPENAASSKRFHSSQKNPVKRRGVQRVKINQEQAMDTYGMQPSSSEYNNLMQDICTSMVNQSTEFSKRKSGVQGSLSSTTPVQCHICHATLSNTLCLRNHIQGTHLALKLKKCNLCGETFKWPMQLARHKKRVHGGGVYFNIYNT